jgi:hypothetical protein
MRVAGSFTNPDWNPSGSPQMELVGDNLWRLDYSTFNGTGSRQLKFVAGNDWSALSWGDKNLDGFGDREENNNIVLQQNAQGTYRFEFNDQTLAYSIRLLQNSFADRYPGISANQTVRGLQAKMEYLFGGTAAQAPSAVNLPTTSIVGSTMRLSFVRRTDDSALKHVVESRTDLASGNWVEVTALPTQQSAGTDLERWTYDLPITGDARRFYRIRAW